jgi:hypothetical protein
MAMWFQALYYIKSAIVWRWPLQWAPKCPVDSADDTLEIIIKM